MAAEDEGRDVFHGDLELFRDEGLETGRVQHAGHADDTLAREAGLLERGLRHRVERVGDDDDDAVGRVRDDLAHHAAHDAEVGVQQVVAAHAGLAWNAGSDDNDVGVGGVGVVVCADDLAVALFDGHGLEKIERLALRHAFNDVDEDDIGKFLGGDPMSGGGADVAGPDDCDFLTHGGESPEKMCAGRWERGAGAAALGKQ